MPFPEALAQGGMHATSFRIRTFLAEYISYDDIHYTTWTDVGGTTIEVGIFALISHLFIFALLQIAVKRQSGKTASTIKHKCVTEFDRAGKKKMRIICTKAHWTYTEPKQWI